MTQYGQIMQYDIIRFRASVSPFGKVNAPEAQLHPITIPLRPDSPTVFELRALYYLYISLSLSHKSSSYFSHIDTVSSMQSSNHYKSLLGLRLANLAMAPTSVLRALPKVILAMAAALEFVASVFMLVAFVLAPVA